ncbi:hypothetical protein N656DRAFT_778811 [Canariomyces notabilis]|uniref:Uncharacterized protein n=1 Tax=Canariomyces notabilis TaxID=2074819 RepID=A0AAN6YU82_9PEZI|nr:hypothetical protein N656DRAFT_778811 [Canariomyces arenarius]
MPRLLDEVQINNALQSEAFPALERLAANPDMHDRALRRFDRDEPPPYESSTEDEEENAMFHPALGLNANTVLDDFKDLMDAPLSDDEQREVAYRLYRNAQAYDPGERYRTEQRIEQARVDSFAWSYHASSDEAKKYLGPGRVGRERRNIIVRRNIKRRWQKLGVWNPQWGIPDRQNNPQPNDNPSQWKWRWQHDSPAIDYKDPQHPITRAVRLRQGLRRNEHSPVPPRSRLQEDAPASQAESFIISRPWFMYSVEAWEETERFHRIPFEKRRLYREPMWKHVNERWKLRGDWREDWKHPSGEFAVGWKWRHESPSPEPEDLTPLNTMDMEFTPSEVDALEAIPPPTPPPEPRPYYPRGHPLHVRRTGLFASPSPEASPEPSSPNDPPKAPEPAQPPALPQRRRQRRRRDENPAQPLRRSPRIAAMEANLLAPPPQERRTARPVPARPPADKPKRGRPRKAKESAVSKAPAPARPRQGATTGQKQPRGRPRKDTVRK